MQFQNLLSVLTYIKESLENQELKELYAELELRFHPNRSRSRLQALGDYGAVKMQIEILQKKLHPKQWDQMKWSIFRKLNGHRFIGEEAILELDSLLNRQGLTQEVAHAELKQMGEGMAQLLAEVDMLITRLTSVFTEDEPGPSTPAQTDLLTSSVSVFYDKIRSVDTLQDVITQFQVWRSILIAFNTLIRENVQEPRLVDIEKNPQLIFVLSTYPLIIRTVARATLDVLNTRLSSMKIRSLRLQTQKVQLNGKLGVIKDLEAKFEEAERSSRKEGLEQLRSSFLNEYGWDHADSAKLEDQLLQALEDLYDFTENGGTIDVSAAADDGSIKKSLSDAFGNLIEVDSEIRRMVEGLA